MCDGVSHGNISSRCLSLKSHTDIGMNDTRCLFVFNVMVLTLLDEGRKVYLLGRICILSLMILVALHSMCFSYRAVIFK